MSGGRSYSKAVGISDSLASKEWLNVGIRRAAGAKPGASTPRTDSSIDITHLLLTYTP